MVFGWAQVLMDIQPLLVLITGKGHLHGFSHTFIGALLLGTLAAVSGKPLSELGLRIMGMGREHSIVITWPVAVISGFIGSFSHVLIDGVMHSDLQPFYPASDNNPFLGWITVTMLHKLCLYSGLLGAGIFFGIQLKQKLR